MYLSICTGVYGDLSYPDMLDKVKSHGLDHVELCVGGDNIACESMFGFPEKMDKQAPEARERIERELLG